MINFEQPVTRIQVGRFQAIQHFLGQCIDNITDHLKTLQTVFSMQIEMGTARGLAKQAYFDVGLILSDYRELELPVGIINRATGKLEQLNEAGKKLLVNM